MTAASGRYIRRSAPTSVAIGRMLDEGARVIQNHAARNPSIGRFHSATTLTARSTSTSTQRTGAPSWNAMGVARP